MLGKVGRVVRWLLAGLAGSTAILTAWLFVMGASVPVRLHGGGHVYTHSWDEGWVAAKGTWTIDNGRQGFPIQVTELICRRSTEVCTVATAQIGFSDTLSVLSETLQIARWTNDTLILTNKEARCADYTYTISRANERAIGTRTSKNHSDPHCDLVTKDALQLSLVDGEKITSQLGREARARTEPFAWASLAVVWLFVGSRLLRIRRGASGMPANSA